MVEGQPGWINNQIYAMFNEFELINKDCCFKIEIMGRWMERWKILNHNVIRESKGGNCLSAVDIQAAPLPPTPHTPPGGAQTHHTATRPLPPQASAVYLSTHRPGSFAHRTFPENQSIGAETNSSRGKYLYAPATSSTEIIQFRPGNRHSRGLLGQIFFSHFCSLKGSLLPPNNCPWFSLIPILSYNLSLRLVNKKRGWGKFYGKEPPRVIGSQIPNWAGQSG